MNERSIFAAALDIADAAERATYLDQVCGDNADLRRRLDELLAAQEKLGSFLARPLPLPQATIDCEPIAERPGTVIGPYKLMEQIGEGGMGLVFVAEQQHPVRRKVALKIIKPGMDTREVIARFEAERQALALLDHPNIARILDAGATDSGRPYFVMELVKGIPLTDYCDQNQLTPRERLGLFVSVCQAVQHAHTKGIIHRDLKPSNILIAPHDGKPVVKVIDFGVAKALGQALTDKTIYTRLTQMIGTPLYMSPEQAEINALDVDTRSDVYALAVLLYELLTGTTPFDRQRFGAAAYDEIRRIIREEEPPRPSMRLTTLGDAMAAGSAKRKTELGRLSALVKGDLDWVVMKGLDKDRTRRYETASAFAADVRRYLSEEPVEARPPSAGYRLRKFVRRNRGPVVTAAVLLLVVLVGIGGTTWGMLKALAARAEEAEQRRLALASAAEAKTNEQKAKNNETKAEWRLYASHIDLAQRELDSHDFLLLYHYLDQCRSDFRGWEHDFLYTLANQHHQTLRGHKDEITCVAFSPDGKLVASAGYGNPDKQGGGFLPGEVKLWDLASGQVLRTLTGHKGSVRSVAFSPDGKSLASASSAGNKGEIKIWDVASGQPLRTLKGEKLMDVEQFLSVAFSPDGKRLASGALTVSYPSPGPDGKPLASGSLNSKVAPFVKIWDVASGREILALKGHSDKVHSVGFSPDGKRLASASWDQTVKVWDTASGQVILTIKEAAASRLGVVWSVAFSPDGKRLAGGHGNLGLVKCWDAVSGQELLTLKGHTGGVSSVAFSPDGKRLASASGDSTVKVWEAASGHEVLTLRGHSGGVSSVAFSVDSKSLASAGGDGTVKLWDLARTQGVLTIKALDFAFSPDGKRLATSADLDLKLWDIANGEVLRTLIEPPAKKAEDGGFGRGSILAAFSPDGKQLATSTGGTLKLWDAGSGKEVRTLMKQFPPMVHLSCMAFSPDGKRLACVLSGDIFFDQPAPFTVKVWNTAGGQEIWAFQGPVGKSRGMSDPPRNGGGPDKDSVAFSPDGKRLTAVEGNRRWVEGEVLDFTQKVWDADTGQVVLTLEQQAMVHTVAFSPDGKRLATATSGEVKLWDAASGQNLLALKQDLQELYGDETVALVFSPDGKRLATASNYQNTVKVWDAASGQEVLTLRGHTRGVYSVAFSPDGKRLATASDDGTVKLWEMPSGQEVLTLRGHAVRVDSVAFSADGKRLASSSIASNGTIKIWDASKSMKEIGQK